MPRFLISSQNISGSKIKISKPKLIHHLKDVLRFKIGDEIKVFDEAGCAYDVVLEKLSAQALIAKIKEKYLVLAAKKIRLDIACAIPKKSKMDDIVDKLSQLGVDKIIPLETQRTIIRLDKDKKTLRQKRWQKIAECAAQQSQRSDIPLVESVKSFKEIIAVAGGYDLKIIPHLSGKRKSLQAVLEGTPAKNILVLIGPEGDFTPGEVAQAKKCGFLAVSLGETVLRVETAAVAAASFIRLYADS